MLIVSLLSYSLEWQPTAGPEGLGAPADGRLLGNDHVLVGLQGPRRRDLGLLLLCRHDLGADPRRLSLVLAVRPSFPRLCAQHLLEQHLARVAPHQAGPTVSSLELS